MDLLLKVRIYLIFYIFLLTDAKDVNLTKIKRNDVKIKNEKYETEKILDIRRENERIEYLVKWKKYKDTENIWEPVNYLINA